MKEINSGENGTIYLTEDNLIYKLERLDTYDTPLQSEYYKQIDFNDNLAKYHPDKFLTLVSHGIIPDCIYRNPNYDKVLNKLSESAKKRYIRKNNQPNCFYLLYQPYLMGTFDDIKHIIHEDADLFLDFINQIIESINIMRENGYSHNDINSQNIMYKKEKDKYQWYIIDYGNVYHEKYPPLEEKKLLHGYDIIMFVNMIKNALVEQHIHSFHPRPRFVVFRDNIKKEPEFSNIRELLRGKIPLYRFCEIYFMIKYPKIYLKCINAPNYEKYIPILKHSELLAKFLL